LDQQIDALRAWVSRKGYKVLAEIRGEGWSAAVSEAAGLTSVILRNALKIHAKA